MQRRWLKDNYYLLFPRTQELRWNDEMMKWASIRIKRNYFYIYHSIKFSNLFVTDVIEAQGTNSFKKQLHGKIPKVKNLFFPKQLSLDS